MIVPLFVSHSSCLRRSDSLDQPKWQSSAEEPVSLARLQRIERRDGVVAVFPFGYRMSLLTLDETLVFFRDTIALSRKTVLLSINQHALYVALCNHPFAQLLQRHHAHIDGMPMLLLVKLAGAKIDRRHRFGGIDLLPALLQASSEQGWSVFYLGGSETDLRAGLAELRARWPQARLSGHHGYFDRHPASADNDLVVEAIHAARTDILLVGMSMGPQEQWIFENYDRLQVPVIVTVGATIRYFAGTEPIPPGWLRHSGFEWTYRLAFRPRMLWCRYFVEPPLTLVGLVLTGRLWNWHKAAGERTFDRHVLASTQVLNWLFRVFRH